MKRLIALFLMMVIMLSLAACGNGNDSDGSDINQSVADNSDSVSNNANGSDDSDDSNVSDDTNEATISIDSVKNAKETDASLFEYEDVDGGVSITKFNGSDEIVVIPQTIDGKTVVSIGKSAFANNVKIRGLRISDTIHTIGYTAFGNCTELEVFVSGASLKKLDSYSFNCCTKLRDVELNQGLESMIQCFGFADISEIEIPSSVTEMFVPFCVPNQDYYITIIGEADSYVEQYVKENGEGYNLIFQAK